jgi:hypothetical protein
MENSAPEHAGLSDSKRRLVGAIVVLAVLVVAALAARAVVVNSDTGTPAGAASGGGAKEDPKAGPATIAAMGGIGPGTQVGRFNVESVTEPVRGGILIRTKEGAVFEVRLLTTDPPPPASAGRYSVYYRRPRKDVDVSEDALVAGAQAIAAKIGAAADAPTPSGLMDLPKPKGQAL